MGVDTKAIIRNGTTLTEIKKALELKYGDVRIRNTHESYFFQVIFNVSEEEYRMMSVFCNDYGLSDYGIPGVLLSLGCSGSSVEIMKYLCEYFGGYLDENDCDDEGFYPINIEEYNKGTELTRLDKFKHEVIQQLGYDNLSAAMILFKKYKEIDLTGESQK